MATPHTGDHTGGHTDGHTAAADHSHALAGVFSALGDPTRTRLISRLVAEGRGTATSLTAVTDVSRQAVDRHLRVLSDAGLVESHREGREVVYALRPQTLARTVDWLAHLGREWEARLLDIKAMAEAE